MSETSYNTYRRLRTGSGTTCETEEDITINESEERNGSRTGIGTTTETEEDLTATESEVGNGSRNGEETGPITDVVITARTDSEEAKKKILC